MFLLAIETSCDETAVAVARCGDADGISIAAHQISSQVDLHRDYGGIVPEVAARAHLSNLPLIIDTVMREAQIAWSDLGAVAVTAGPGLKGCLLVGIGAAQGIAVARGLPLLALNHIEGHLLAPFLDNPALEFPYLALVVSGGHTELVEVYGIGDYRVRARTTDDAAGEAFDKSAHLLGFPYPGGPQLAALADATAKSRFTLPKVMREAPGFSFSGLKTAISLLIQRHEPSLRDDPAIRAELALAVQEAIIDALVFKLQQAIGEGGFRRVVLTGGVAANRALRERVQRLQGVELFLPKPIHCTDNAAMIAYAAARRFERGERGGLTIEPRARWPVEELAAHG